MQIVIEISEEEYAWIKRASRQTTPLDRFCVKAIANGVPLPEHGRLIDKSAMLIEGSRLKGKWRTYYSPGSTVRCSNCWKSFRTEWDFCPNCGADMRESEEYGMLTLEEAIKHCEEVAEENEKIAGTFEYSLKTKSDCKKCAKKHRQLASWLRELKSYKDAKVGCEYCKHKYREQHERPCSLCQRNFMDMFEYEREINDDDES